MKSSLDQIEARLRSLIEASSQFFPPGNLHTHLAEKLVDAMKDSLLEENGTLIAPNSYIIFLNPHNISSWQSEPEMIESLIEILEISAREAGLKFSTRPSIQLESSQVVKEDYLQVTASYFETSVGKTAILPVQMEESSEQDEKLQFRKAYLILNGSQFFPLTQMVTNIGRRPDNHIVLDDPRISRVHAQIRQVRGKYVLFDLEATGGTFVNGHRVTEYTLKPGDVISLAGVNLIYGEDTAGPKSEPPSHTITTRFDQKKSKP
jgi:hypothetical protein